MNFQETGRKSATTKTQAFRSKPTQNTKIETLHKPKLKRKQQKKEN